jgi:plasmid segregation protein ParM
MNRHPKLLGLDIGFGFTKCVGEERAVILDSRLQPCPQDDADPSALTAGGYLLELPEGRFLVGQDRRGASASAAFARRPERLLGEYAKSLALTAAALFSEQEAPLQIVLGLPLAETQRWQPILKEGLAGYHKFSLAEPAGPWIHKNIHIRKVHVVPHPLGTFINLIMDREGRLRDSDGQHQKLALVDIGFRTTDVMVMEAGRFCNRGSATIEMGIGDALAAMARKLGRNGAASPDWSSFYRAVCMGVIRIGEETYDLNAWREESYQQLAAALADQINFRLREDWDLERLLLTGGAAGDLAEHLAPLLHGEIDLIEHEKDTRLNNAQGHFSLARHMWGGSGLCRRTGSP